MHDSNLFNLPIDSKERHCGWVKVSALSKIVREVSRENKKNYLYVKGKVTISRWRINKLESVMKYKNGVGLGISVVIGML